MTRVLKTHCPKGHPYSPENTYTVGKRRWCKRCKWDYLSRTRKAKTAAKKKERIDARDYYKTSFDT